MKKNFLTLISCLMVISSISASALEDNLNQDLFMNISFEIPDNWEYVSEEAGNASTVYDFKCGYELMYIFCTHYRDEYDETAVTAYDDLLTGVADSYVGYENYTSIVDTSYEIEGFSAHDNACLFNINDDVFFMKTTAVNTGYEVVTFVYGRSVAADNVGYDSYNEMVSTIKLNTLGTINYESSDNITKYESGNYKVGTDISSGEYIIFADDSGQGYFCVSSDSNKNNILFNNNFDYNSIITIKDGDYLELKRCYAVPISENPTVDTSGSGMFLVGTHIPAGEYKIDSGDQNGYYCIYSDSRQDNIVANGNFKGQNYVTVSEGQYLVLSRCSIVNTPDNQ